MERSETEPKHVWEEYPGYSFAVQMYHSFDMQMIGNYNELSEEDLEMLAEATHHAHLLVMAKMDQDDFLDLLRSVNSNEDRKQITKDWKFVCSVFSEEFEEFLIKHKSDKGN